MTAVAKKVLRIAELRAVVVGQIEDSSGKLHDVLSINLQQYQAFRKPPEGQDDFELMREIVSQLVPTLPAEELGKLNVEGGKAITALAGGGIEVVEEMFPNAVGPASSTSPA